MKVTINIEKRYAYTIIGLLVIISGIFAVYAQFPDAPNPGHSASEVGGGVFPDPAYNFSADLFVNRYLIVGNALSGITPKIWIAALNGGDSSAIAGLENSIELQSSTGQTFMTFEKDGDLVLQNSAGITLGGEKRTNWPDASDAFTLNSFDGSFLVASSGSEDTGVSSINFPNAVIIFRGASQYDSDRRIFLTIDGSSGTWIVTAQDNVKRATVHYTLLYWG